MRKKLPLSGMTALLLTSPWLVAAGH